MQLPPLSAEIGIWGFGRVGKSVARVLVRMGYTIAVMDSDRKILSDNFLIENNISIFMQDQHDEFFALCDIVIPSPGIDLRPCKSHNHVWLAELDLFYMIWQRPIIAITGSVGKTTVTSMLADLCTYNDIPVLVGGNIGNAACTLLESVVPVEYAILEVSSFQLELCRLFTPTIAIITNLYENHLDRHDTYEAYWQAKAAIIRTMSTTGICIVPWELRNNIRAINQNITIYYIDSSNNYSIEINEIKLHETLFRLIKNDDIQNRRDNNRQEIKIVGQSTEKIQEIDGRERYQTHEKPKNLFDQTLRHNALLIYTALQAINNKKVLDISFDIDYMKREHRLEYVGSKNSTIFINDSKATTIASSLAAIDQYKNHPIILILGGLSKGVNREILIQLLPTHVKEVICFGAEAHKLATWCMVYNKPAGIYATLDEAFVDIQKIICPGDIVLLSPAGSSFDLYKNYEERGNHFKQLFQNM
ncbi:MAG TPA: UDP-N-acetylmuramoyl-L-alanine--D-glutamate ligase [Candidatus Babeliales bacterium]|jgi:UDP-N-acetylmuramoylalanine--D-glutamate ligase|nr:UDP-N-acetylmuramoyl-L-alanine--D-glutamate ligase [Candidatus Babeliales bacterium]